jgi:hypothetical protein
MSMKQSLRTFLSTLAGVAAAFAAFLGVGAAVGLAGGTGGAALGFAVFLSDLGPLAIAEVGGGLIQKEEVGFKAANFFDLPQHTPPPPTFLLAAQEYIVAVTINRSQISSIAPIKHLNVI